MKFLKREKIDYIELIAMVTSNILDKG